MVGFVGEGGGERERDIERGGERGDQTQRVVVGGMGDVHSLPEVGEGDRNALASATHRCRALSRRALTSQRFR